MGPLQMLFAKLLADRAQGDMPADPRARGMQSPPFYSDYNAFYRQPVDRTGVGPMPFRMPDQAGPEPPVGRLEMAYRSMK